VHACDRWGSLHERESEWFGSTLICCCTSVDLLTLHCASGSVVRETKRALKMTMDSVMATINFIRSTSSFQHRLFHMCNQKKTSQKDKRVGPVFINSEHKMGGLGLGGCVKNNNSVLCINKCVSITQISQFQLNSCDLILILIQYQFLWINIM